VRASITQMQAGVSGFRRELQGASRDQGVLDKQMRAFGTTLRYALAGGAIFGTINAISKLGDFQAKLGNISAIGSSAQYPLVGKQLDQLGDQLLRVSTETVTPINQLEEAVTNLYSTVDNISPDQAVSTIETVAKTARISQADITDTTQAILGMMNAFDKSMQDIPSLGDEFFTVTKYASGGVDFARVYAQQLGKLSQTARQGGFTLEEMSAIAISASKFGGSPASNLRAQAQLQRTVLTPSNKKSEAFYQEAGVGKVARRGMNGFEVLMKLLTYANTLDTGRKREFMAGAFTRAESRNIAQLLSLSLTQAQLQTGAKRETLGTYLGYTGREARTRTAADAFSRVMDMNSIQQAGQAMQNASIAIADAFSPIINPASRGITRSSLWLQRQSAEHPHEVAGVLGASAAGLFAARMFGRGGLGGRLGGAGLRAGAISDIATGGKIRGDSPLNPLYVVMVSELLGRNRGINQFPGGQGPAGMPPAASGRGLISRIFGPATWFGKGASKLGRSAIPGMDAAMLGGLAIPLALDQLGISWLDYGANDAKNLSAFPRVNRLIHRDLKKRPFESLSPAEQRAMVMTRDMTVPRLKAAEAMLDSAVGGVNGHVTGKATVTVNLDQADAKGNVQRKTVKVPVPLFGAFTSPAPQTAGKNKTTRGK
jgi:hypothetical protein